MDDGKEPLFAYNLQKEEEKKKKKKNNLIYIKTHPVNKKRITKSANVIGS